jgi:ComF family protein
MKLHASAAPKRLEAVLKQTGSRLTDALKDAVFPLRCLQCGSIFHPGPADRNFPKDKIADGWLGTCDLSDIFRILMRPYLCSTCINGFIPADSPLCRQCGLIFASSKGEDRLCEACIRSPKYFRVARAGGVYDQAMMAVIHALKYKGKVQLAYPLSMLLLCVLISRWRSGTIDLVVPVPLFPKRFRRRGFNQAYMVVRPWRALLAGLNGPASGMTIHVNGLKRIRPTRAQTGLGRQARLSNVSGAFEISSPEQIKGKQVLIVDDVYTTGATVNECARVLLKGGAAAVDVLTVARAM